MKDIWLELKNRILEVPEIKVVDLLRNQFAETEKNHPLDYPAVLLHFDNMTFVQYSMGVQLCNCTLNVLLACEKYADFASYSQDANEALQIFDIHDKVYAKLQGFAGLDETSVIAAPMQRINEVQDTNYNHIYVFVMGFELTFYEQAVGLTTEYSPVNLGLITTKDIF